MHELERSHPRGGLRCSTGSAMRGESLVATASAGRWWLLVEIAGAWGWSAFSGSPALDASLGRELARRAERAGWRLLAIRRPGRRGRTGRHRWAVVDTAPDEESIRWGEAREADALLTDPFVPGAGVPSSDPIIAVCAHGRHDECCAVRGRRVAADLAERFPDLTWECSHIGGDRFAATMILFPHGLNYGRVDHADAPQLVDEYLAGRIVPDHYRGRTAFSRAEQAAQAAARERFGDLAVDAYPPIASRATADGAEIELGSGSGRIEVRLTDRVGDPLFTMCTETEPVRVRAFEVSGVLAR